LSFRFPYFIQNNIKKIFLDEPTSGLDSFTSYNVMEILGQIASNQRTVVCTIHQPRSNIFTLFDKILLLSEGFSSCLVLINLN